MNDEDSFFAHMMYEKLHDALTTRKIDPAILHLIYHERNEPEMQRVINDAFTAVAMTIEQHKNNRHTFDKFLQSKHDAGNNNGEDST